MRRGIALGVGVATVGVGLVSWLAWRDGGGAGSAAGAPRFESLADLADRLNDLGYGCDDFYPMDVRELNDGLFEEPRSASGSCPSGDTQMDLGAFADTGDQAAFRDLAERYACAAEGDDFHFVNGNLWVVELVSPDPAERTLDAADQIARDLDAERVTIDC